MSPTALRPATLADLNELLALEAASFSDAWQLQSLATALNDEKYLVLVAQHETEVIGYLLGWNVGEEAEVARVGVQDTWRGQGIGKRLLTRSLDDFRSREVNVVFLEVRVSNQAALRLYESCGFGEIARRKKYYADGEDAIVMNLVLN